MRHGSRNPSEKQINKSNAFLNDIKEYRSNKEHPEKSLLDELFQSFVNVEPRGLTKLGEQEMKEIAFRFKNRFPHIIPTAKALNIKSSSKTRSVKSAQSFLRSWYTNEDVYSSSIESIVIDDKMMRSFDQCDRYVRDVKENPAASNELDLFKKGEYIQKLINEFKIRNGIEDLNAVKISKILPSLIWLFRTKNLTTMYT
jgi:multiple inositol-polyphosphate phosphatase/2,3-bisphosphoglycerate 3-phosphatase